MDDGRDGPAIPENHEFVTGKRAVVAWTECPAQDPAFERSSRVIMGFVGMAVNDRRRAGVRKGEQPLPRERKGLFAIFNWHDRSSNSPAHACPRTKSADSSAQGNCSKRTLFGVVLPTFWRMGSRSLALPVYFT